MKVLIYVEGPSDKLAMQALLRPLLEQKRLEGKHVSFIPAEGKDRLLRAYPQRAADFIAENWQHQAVILPDLHPKNKGIPHENLPELTAGLRAMVEQRLKSKQLPAAEVASCLTRFHVHFFKHDLEVLVLAAEPQLLTYLGRSSVPTTVAWNRADVESQNNARPPKYVVEELFQACARQYRETTDAALILENCQYEDVVAKCPESFKPLVALLKAL